MTLPDCTESNIIDSYFVIRQKSHLNYEIVDGEDLLDNTDNVLLD